MDSSDRATLGWALVIIVASVVAFASDWVHLAHGDALVETDPTPIRSEEVPTAAPTAEPQAFCFLRHRRGGSDRLSRARQRNWITELDRLVHEAVAGLDPAHRITSGLVLAVAFHESSWKPRARGRSHHEYGLMQVLPSRLRLLGLRPGEDPLDPAVNLRLGVTNLEQCVAACGPEDRGDVLRCYAAGRCKRLDRNHDGHRERDRKVEVMQSWADQADECAL